MHFAELPSLIAKTRQALLPGPVALVMVEDMVEVDSTFAHLKSLGFAQIVAVGDAAFTAGADAQHRLDYDVSADNALPDLVNALIKAMPDTWFYYCYNGEYLFYPFCEHRNVREMLGFMQEERRKTVMSYVIDLYARDLGAHPNGVDRATACFDKSGYYAVARADAAGSHTEPQLHIAGGLRWRFEEHIPKDRQRTDRVSFFRAEPGLQMLPDRTFNVAEYNTVSCPWHHNLTAAVASFRTAKALRRNPGSRDAISGFQWPQSIDFEWSPQQLLDLGMMEPGQWF